VFLSIFLGITLPGRYVTPLAIPVDGLDIRSEGLNGKKISGFVIEP